MATNKFPTNLHAKFQALVNAITALLPATVNGQTFPGFDFSYGNNGLSQQPNSNGFRIILEVDPTGQVLTVRTMASNEGQNNAFGPADASGHYTRVPPLVVPATIMP